ncbi:tetratricopeptide repeat protein [Amycolatopsis sp. NBC_00355]|uniref:tetratricopeptide repeat protein n=1 Tax=Amycolatopsis sp. NBC_00355 TaxID=2975957 RepID=UPI003FA458D8
MGSRNNLAYAYRAAGDVERALSFYEAALAGFEKLLGAEHPTTEGVRRNLRYARGSEAAS